MRLKRFLLATPILILIALELVARMAGTIDFPLYDANNLVGYVPKANQSGSFLNRNDWAVNDRNMGTRSNWTDGADDLLLVGDSIVWGGNSYAENDRLGPNLQRLIDDQKLSKRVWPISAGSWAVVNETNWLHANPDVFSSAETIVFIFNSKDFGAPSSWADPFTHPREHPYSALAYLAQKYVVESGERTTPEPLRVPSIDPVAALADVVSSCGCTVHIWLYPTKDEFLAPDSAGKALEDGFKPFIGQLGASAKIHRVSEITGWAPTLYKDDIHPTPEGMRILAGAIAKSLNE